MLENRCALPIKTNTAGKVIERCLPKAILKSQTLSPLMLYDAKFIKTGALFILDLYICQNEHHTAGVNIKN